MCGLVGIASVSTIEDRAWLGAGSDAIQYRGPDDSGEWWSHDFRIGMAHRRLSIVDLSALGHQPMQLAGRGVTLVLNGEIYNFRELRSDLERRGHSFRSTSDTEVLLVAYAQWGIDCLSRLNGMFAFALFDERLQRLFLARDRAGEKPLYYSAGKKVLHFASEAKALLADPSLPRRINGEALNCYLGFGYVPGDRCIYDGIKKLLPGHVLTFDLRDASTTVSSYWALPEQPSLSVTDQANEADLVDELEGLLEDSVRRQLVADVPVGILLSGGLDSSLVTALAARCTQRLKTFTVGFPGAGLLDETHHARLIASHFGTEHTELMADANIADLIPQIAGSLDEPLADSSMVPTFIVSRLVRQHCPVALGGDGGDELFAGYSTYSRALRLQKVSLRLPLPLRRFVASGAQRFLPIGYRGRNWLLNLAGDFQRSLPVVAPYFDAPARRRLFQTAKGEGATAEGIMELRVPKCSDLIQRLTRMDFENHLPNDILLKVDRASMLNSLEIRSPLLDRHVIDFAFGKVPSGLKIKGGNQKVLLKRLASRHLPSDFDFTRKQGFSLPTARWIQGGALRDLFWAVLSDNRCCFDRREVVRLLNSQDRGYSNSERIFALVVFELWRTANHPEMS